jgi:hypothetical protein
MHHLWVVTKDWWHLSRPELYNVPMSARVLTPVERLLLSFCDDERQAIALAPHVNLPSDATEQEIESAVILALVRAKEACSGRAPQLEFVSGQRRDTLRLQ